MDLIQMSFMGGVMILAVVVVRAVAINRLPKKTFLALWTLVLCRLLIPFSLASPWCIYGLAGRFAPAAPPPPVTEPPPLPILWDGDTAITEIASVQNTASVLPSVSPLFFLWMGGFALCLAFFAASYWRCRREFSDSLPLSNSFTQAWLAAHPLKRQISIRQSDRISAPLTFGIFRPVILLPKGIHWENFQELSCVFAHELVHIRRLDALTKLFLILALCLHWFNPLVWVMYLLANRDLELSCDEAVVKSMGENTRSHYALALLNMEEQRSLLRPICNSFSRNALQERIVAIMKTPKASLTSVLISLGVVCGIFTACATTPPQEPTPQNQEIDAVTETTAYSSTETSSQIDYVQAFQPYQKFGLIYDGEKQQLFYQEELVRYFEDLYPVGDNGFSGLTYLDKNGTVDVHGIRDLSDLIHYSDGSYDPSGRLTGVAAYTQEEFEARDIDVIAQPAESTAVEGNPLTEQELEKLYGVYAPFGLTYDAKTGRMTYDGKSVRYFRDVLSSNGETMESGKFKGSLRTLTLDPTGTVDVYTTRDYSKPDKDGFGLLTGVRPFTQAEFDRRSENSQSGGTLIEYALEDVAINETTLVTEEVAISRAEYYAPYASVGVEFRENEDRLFYKDAVVSQLCDPQASLYYGVPDGSGLCLQAVYTDGKLTGVEKITDKQAAELRKAIEQSTSKLVQTSVKTSSMTWPVPDVSAVTSTFGWQFNGNKFHAGMDIGGKDADGKNVVAASSGTVEYVKTVEGSEKGGYGLHIVISHGNEISTLYGHLSSINVSVGDQVNAGQVIGQVGSTGAATGPCLHFELRENGKALDPSSYFI